jgi:hypothetical protein
VDEEDFVHRCQISANKSGSQAIHIYSMTCFIFSIGLYDHINSPIRKFLWGSIMQRESSLGFGEVVTRPKFLSGL